MSTPVTNPVHTIMRTLLRAIDAADWLVVESLLHPGAEYEVSGQRPIRGSDGIMNYYKNVRAIRKGEHLIESMAAEGNNGVCWGRFNATRQDGTEISVLFSDVMQFEQNKIRKRRVYYCEPIAGR
jgi:ketosteroid isomerase-like protein